MEENTTALLEKLAEKLGTTTEYLWGVLLSQAPIYAISYVVILLIVVLGGGFGLIKLHKYLSGKTSEYEQNYYDEYDSACFVMVGLVIIYAIISLMFLFSSYLSS